MNNKLYIATIFNYIQRLHILNWKGITYHIYSNNIATILNNIWKWIYILIYYLPVKPPALTPYPLFLLLPQQHRVLPSVFFFFPKIATPPTQQHHEDVLPSSSSSSSPTQQHHEDVLPSVFFFFLNATTPRRCSPLSYSPTPRRRSLLLSDYQTTICSLPTSHRIKDEDSRLRQWWI